MKNLTLSNKTEYQVSVNKAHKILSTLKAMEGDKRHELDYEFARNSKSKKIHTFTLDMATILTYNNDDLKNLLSAQIDKRVEIFLDAIEVLEDIRDLKEAIFSFNVTQGISEKLSFIEKKKTLVAFYEKVIKNSFSEAQSIDFITEKLIKLSEKEFDSNEEIEIEHQYWNKEHVQSELKHIKEQILAYEDDILTLNATQKIKISLYKSSAEHIGL